MFSGASGQFALDVETTRLPETTKQSRILSQCENSSEFSSFGGWKGKRVEETGFFHVISVNGVWEIVDPDGYIFYSVGINSVVKGGGFTLPDSLWNISANTMGCWSDETINTETSHKIPYTPRWNMMMSYKNTSQRTKDLFDMGIIPVFDNEFPTFCLQLASIDIAPLKDDPYILGHFSDNELPIYDNTSYGKLLDRFLGISDKMDPNYLAAHNWMKARSGVGYVITDQDREEFHGYVAGTYYKIVNTAIKHYDPNHLYLGSRLHGAAKSKPSIFRAAGEYVDIISINVYSVWTPDESDMDMWMNESGRPFLVTEFYAKAVDSGLPNTSGAGWLVNTQEDRAEFFENFTLGLLTHPGSVGFHYFKYIDKDTYNTGLVSAAFDWYLPMKNSFHKMGKDIYNLRFFMLNGYVGEKPASIYSSESYKGKARLLPAGEYTKEELLSLGMDGNSIASLRMRPGAKVILYSADNFMGDSLVISENCMDLASLGFISKTSSLKVILHPTAIEDKEYKKLKVEIFPVPVLDIMHISIEKFPEIVEYTIYSVSGSSVLRGKLFSGHSSIDLSTLASGFYFIRFNSVHLKETLLFVKEV